MKQEVHIGNRIIGDGQPVYIIAEIGLNHQGDVSLAKRLIDEAVRVGADCAKFQKRSLKHLYQEKVLERPDQQEHALQYLMDHIIKCELSDDDMRELQRYATEQGIDFMCTPWDIESLGFITSLGVPALKIGSPDMSNLPLIRAAAATGLPLIVSTGMSYVTEIWQVVDELERLGASFVMLHCNSTYPAPFYDLNLNFLKKLREKTQRPVGFSGHDQSIGVAVAAVALGARVIEKHLTFDREMPGPDHKASLTPDEFAGMVKNVRIVEQALGDTARFPSRGEFLNRENLAKSLVAAHPLKKGHVLTPDDIGVKSPGKGTSPLKIDLFIGKKLLTRDLDTDDYLLESDIQTADAVLEATPDIKHHWGVVARMCDIDGLLACQSPYVEIHLSDSDVNNDVVNPASYDRDLVIHAPEYDGDVLLNLSSLDERKRAYTVAFFNKTLEHGRHLKNIFKNGNDRIKFVVHPGGMNMERPLLKEIDRLNDQLLKSLKELNGEGFEILVENMPACPWYFGGQWWHASFMDSSEIVDFSRRSGHGVVFDTSHAGLFCNYYKKDLIEYAETILPVTRYIHISDAAGFGGEGLQIGDGSVDFKKLLDILVKTDVWFLPEIWQGHKFGGEGFLKAVRTLKSIHPGF